MNYEPRDKIGGLFKKKQISVLPEKCIFTDFNNFFHTNLLLRQTMSPTLHGSIIFKKYFS